MQEIKIRWINAVCYEIILENQKRIVTDPYISVPEVRDFAADDVTGADYLFVTHTHYDHTADVGAIAKKFGSRVFVNAFSALDLARYFDINFNQIYPVLPNERYTMPDITVEAYAAKHKLFLGKQLPSAVPARMDAISEVTPEEGKFFGGPRHKDLNSLGFLYVTDYIITTPGNCRMMIVTGATEYSDIYGAAQKQHPNILFRQLADEWTPEECAKILEPFHAPAVFPVHHEKRYRRGENSEYTKRVNEALRALGSSMTVLDPEPYRWYTYRMSVDL